MPFKDYYGNPIIIPAHTHVTTDTLNDQNTIALATSTEDGFMSSEYKTNLNTLETDINEINEMLKSVVYK